MTRVSSVSFTTYGGLISLYRIRRMPHQRETVEGAVALNVHSQRVDVAWRFQRQQEEGAVVVLVATFASYTPRLVIKTPAESVSSSAVEISWMRAAS